MCVCVCFVGGGGEGLRGRGSMRGKVVSKVRTAVSNQIRKPFAKDHRVSRRPGCAEEGCEYIDVAGTKMRTRK